MRKVVTNFLIQLNRFLSEDYSDPLGKRKRTTFHSAPTKIGLTSGQSYKTSAIVIYESRVVNISNLLLSTTLYPRRGFMRLATGHSALNQIGQLDIETPLLYKTVIISAVFAVHGAIQYKEMRDCFGPMGGQTKMVVTVFQILSLMFLFFIKSIAHPLG